MSFIGKHLPQRKQSRTESLRGGRAPGPNDVFIAVMGVTGSGKSSFISICSDKPVRIGHTLSACTSTVGVYAYDVSPDRTVYLIDTPGFDDTNRSDTEVLSEIAAWLGKSYSSNILLHGIIYLHRITDLRMQGSAMTNLTMFRQLCGTDALKKVILVTTMWDKVSSDEAVMREKQLIDTPKFWGGMLGKGSSCHRHNNTERSARDIVHLLANHNAPIATELQRQLVDEKRTLDQTSAGRELQSEMLKEKEKWAKERRDIEQQMKAAIKQRDIEAEGVMREERDRYTRMIKKVEHDTSALRSTMENLLVQRNKRVARMEKQMEEQQRAHEDELRRIKDRQRRLELEKAELEEERKREKQAQRKREKEAQRERDQAQRERKRQAEREQEKQAQRERERQIQQRQDRQAQKAAPKSTAVYSPPKTTGVYSPYSVTLCGTLETCISPTQWTSNVINYSKGSVYVQALSLGEVFDGSVMWIARYLNGTWQPCQDLVRQYPHLGAKIGSHGLNNLEICTLGPGQRYYARWLDGTYSSWASDQANAALTKCSDHGNGSKILAVALGYGDSYVISYGYRSNMKELGYEYNLKGYYPSLYQFLKENEGNLSIIAIALDPSSTTDFILCWMQRGGDGLTRIHWYTSYDTVWRSINSWWNQGCI